jgi:hypothetical protein
LNLKGINKIAEEKGKKNMKNLSKIRFLVADQSGESIPSTIFALWLNHSGAQGRLKGFDSCTTTPHMRVGPSMWDPPSCEGLLYSCCIGVVNLTFFQIKFNKFD